MSRLKISYRLVFAFGIMVILLIALGGVGLWRSTAQSNELKEVVNRRIPITAALTKLVDGVNDQVIQTRNLAIFSTDSIISSATKRILESRKEVDVVYKDLEILINTEQGHILLKRMHELRGKYASAGTHYLELISSGEKDKAIVWLENNYRPAQIEYQESIRQQFNLQAKRVQEAGARAEASSEALQRDILLAVVASVIVASILALTIIKSIITPLKRAVDISDRISNGDLSGRIDIDASDETGQLLRSMLRMQLNLANTVGIVRRNAENVASASAQIASGNNDLSSRTEEQASALEETAASMEQLGATVHQNAENARIANQMSVAASAVALQGGGVVSEVIATMKSINDSSVKISDIIEVIDGIAFQTNILALNAAVEAARAGEQGRGFAVVAGEVRSLAQRSADAAKEINSLITSSVERVEHGSMLVDKAGVTMAEIVKSISNVTDIMGEISAASREQSAGVGQMVEAITQMDQSTQQNSALVEEMAAAASALNSQAEEMVRGVAHFHIDATPEIIANEKS